MADGIANRDNVYHVGHGIDPDLDRQADPSPYADGLHAVSVGSMLFDPAPIAIASHAFPDITFHVIGSGRGRMPEYGDNVVVYGEMPHGETLRYIKHAASASRRMRERIPAYLADSSLKLLQYDYFALPAVCPEAMVGGYRSRFGYAPGDADRSRGGSPCAAGAARSPSATPELAGNRRPPAAAAGYPELRL